MGECWDKRCQIDVVGLRQDGRTDLGECRWGIVRSARPVRDELEAKVALYPNRRHATIDRRVFTRDPAPRERARPGDPRLRWHDLADLYRRLEAIRAAEPGRATFEASGPMLRAGLPR